MTDTVPVSYESMTVAELRLLAYSREIHYTTKTRKPELIALHQEFDTEANMGLHSRINPADIPVRHGALKLDPRQMRLNYARQNTRNPNLTLIDSFNVKLTVRQERALRKRNRLFLNGKITFADMKKVSA